MHDTRTAKERNTGAPETIRIGAEGAPTRTSADYAEISNFAMTTVCPRCAFDMVSYSCKNMCMNCWFMWDCSEL